MPVKLNDQLQQFYQVVNRHGYPASDEYDWLCIFPTESKAQDWIDYMVEECCRTASDFRIRGVLVKSLTT